MTVTYRTRSWIVTGAVVAGVGMACFGGALLLETTLLVRPPRGTEAALRVATWFSGHRLVESSIRINGSETHGRCAKSWFHIRGRRPAPGTVFRRDGSTLLVVPPHLVETVGRTGGGPALSPLVKLELGGCSQLLAQALRSDALNRRIIGLRRTRIRDSAVLALTIPIDASRLTLYLDRRNYRPTSLTVVTSRGVRGVSRIHFALLTARVLGMLERALPTARR